ETSCVIWQFALWLEQAKRRRGVEDLRQAHVELRAEKCEHPCKFCGRKVETLTEQEPYVVVEPCFGRDNPACSRCPMCTQRLANPRHVPVGQDVHAKRKALAFG